MSYLLGNIVAHKLIKGGGAKQTKTYHSFVLQIIIFSYIQC